MQLSVILDIFITNIVLVIYWFIGEEIRESFKYEVQVECWNGRQWQKTLDFRNLQTDINPPSHELKIQGDDNAFENNYGNNKTELKTPIHSAQWNKELKDWKYLHEKAKNQNYSEGGQKLRSYALFTFFFFVGSLVMYLVLVISPKHYHNEKETWLAFLKEALLDTIVPEMDGAYTILIVIQFCLELALFVAAVIVVKWPKPSLIRADKTQQEHKIRTVKHKKRQLETKLNNN
jgi:hypothetical protein